MPKIRTAGESDAEKVIQALECQTDRGPFVQVGGENIDPSEIISFSGPRDAASFKLSDGRTVQNDKFKAGDVGDLLFDALQVLRRPGKKSQAIKPAFNRAIFGPNSTTLKNGQFENIKSVPNQLYQAIDAPNGVAFAVDANNNQWVKVEISTGTVSKYGIQASTIGSVDVNRDTKKVWVKTTTSSNTLNIEQYNYDGTGGTTVYSTSFTSYAGDNSIGILEQENVGITAMSAGNAVRFQLDGTGTTNLGSASQFRLKASKQEPIIANYSTPAQTITFRDLNWNQIAQINTGGDFNKNAMNFPNAGKRLFYIHKNTSELRSVATDATGDRLEDAGSYSEGIALGFDPTV